jgi:hypothetical protein
MENQKQKRYEKPTLKPLYVVALGVSCQPTGSGAYSCSNGGTPHEGPR